MQSKNINDEYLWNISQISRAFKMGRDTVRFRLKKSGVKPTKKHRNADLYELVDVGPALFNEANYLDLSNINPEELPPGQRKEWYQGEHERLKVQEKTGELMPESELRSELALTMKAVVSFFESLPDKMERARLFKPEQLEALEKECDKYRNQLYSQLIDLEN